MKNAFIINTCVPYEGSNKGELTESIIQSMNKTLDKKGYSVTHTDINDIYDLKTEVEKFAKADVVIFQIPLYWMSMPGEAKTYLDRVFMQGYKTLFESDGRHDNNPEYNYGTGGLCQGKSYMLSITANAPQTAFTDPKEFFNGKTIDELFFWMHQNFKFIGFTKPLPTFLMNDVIKNPNFEENIKRLTEHMEKNF